VVQMWWESGTGFFFWGGGLIVPSLVVSQRAPKLTQVEYLSSVEIDIMFRSNSTRADVGKQMPRFDAGPPPSPNFIIGRMLRPRV
jgi:hypothetical protein